MVNVEIPCEPVEAKVRFIIGVESIRCTFWGLALRIAMRTKELPFVERSDASDNEVARSIDFRARSVESKERSNAINSG
jgi:hypothetical protein